MPNLRTGFHQMYIRTRFTALETVKAKGNSSSAAAYRHTDEQPLSELNYYRLKQVDLDGKWEYSGVIKMQFKKAATFSIYPNPASSFIQVTVPEPAQQAAIRLIANNGQVLLPQFSQHKNTLELSLSVIAPEIYYVELLQGTRRFLEKLVKQ